MNSFDDRITCKDCANLSAEHGTCDAWAMIPCVARGYVRDLNLLHRCVGFRPSLGARDQRAGKERFQWLYKTYLRTGLITVQRKRDG